MALLITNDIITMIVSKYYNRYTLELGIYNFRGINNKTIRASLIHVKNGERKGRELMMINCRIIFHLRGARINLKHLVDVIMR